MLKRGHSSCFNQWPSNARPQKYRPNRVPLLNEEWLAILAYMCMADIISLLNEINVSLQGSNTNTFTRFILTSPVCMGFKTKKPINK